MLTTSLRAQMKEAARRRNAEANELQRLRAENERLARTVQEQGPILEVPGRELNPQAHLNAPAPPPFSHVSGSSMDRLGSTGSRPVPYTGNPIGTGGSVLPPAWESEGPVSSGQQNFASRQTTFGSEQTNTLGEPSSTASEHDSLLTKLLEDTRMALHYLACTRTTSLARGDGAIGNALAGSRVNRLKESPAGDKLCESLPGITTGALSRSTPTSEATPQPSSEGQVNAGMPPTLSTNKVGEREEIEDLLEEMMELTEALLQERGEQEELIAGLQEANADLLGQIEERDGENRALKSMYEPLRTELEQWSERFPAKLREHSMLLFEKQQETKNSKSGELLTIFEAELRGVVKNLLNDLARVAVAPE